MTQSKAVGWKTVVLTLMAVPLMIGIFLWMDQPPSSPAQLTEGQRQSIQSALRTAGMPAAQSVELTNGGWLVATFDVDDKAISKIAVAGITSPKEFASKAVITVRNAALPFRLADSYRVTMNGPSPGPGLITRYGSARFSESGSVSWEPGKSR